MVNACLYLYKAGFVLAVLVTAANVHDTKDAGILLDCAAEDAVHIAAFNRILREYSRKIDHIT